MHHGENTANLTKEFSCKLIDYPLTDSSKIIVVGHGGLFMATIRDICRQIAPGALANDSHNCSISEIALETSDGNIAGTLRRWADASHLYGAAAQVTAWHPASR